MTGGNLVNLHQCAFSHSNVSYIWKSKEYCIEKRVITTTRIFINFSFSQKKKEIYFFYKKFI
jgi:hypothetical protein